MRSASDHDATATTTAEFDTPDRNELTWRITACLRERVPDLHEIRVTAIGNTAAIRGTLRSLHEKRLCLECCRRVPGVRRVIDELIVIDASPASV
jgi:hypothetical protein